MILYKATIKRIKKGQRDDMLTLVEMTITFWATDMLEADAAISNFIGDMHIPRDLIECYIVMADKERK